MNGGFFTKVTCAFLLQENKEELLELNTFKLRKKNDNTFHIIDQISRFQGTIVNRQLPFLHVGSLEITVTVPLIMKKCEK